MKIFLYKLSKHLGLFYVAKFLTRKRLRILCYHGFAYEDEHLFRPKLFMSPSLFEKRMNLLSKGGFSVLSLSDAMQNLTNGTLSNATVVITIDDGWKGVDDIAMPILKQRGYQWTLYLTTYYVQNRLPVINLIIQYFFWKTNSQNIEFGIVDEKLMDIKVSSAKELSEDQLTHIIQTVESKKSVSEKLITLEALSKVLGINLSDINKNDLFQIVDEEQVRHLHNVGVDIQLHSHRHTIGENNELVLEREIKENRQVISNIIDKPLVHFCYPSGYYFEGCVERLNKLGIITATTCEPGLIKKNSNQLLLNRFLDGENISDIEFEAEIYGFAEILRKARSYLSFESS